MRERYMLRSTLIRSSNQKFPFSSTLKRSPVLSQPSGRNVSLVASGLFQYPASWTIVQIVKKPRLILWHFWYAPRAMLSPLTYSSPDSFVRQCVPSGRKSFATMPGTRIPRIAPSQGSGKNMSSWKVRPVDAVLNLARPSSKPSCGCTTTDSVCGKISYWSLRNWDNTNSLRHSITCQWIWSARMALCKMRRRACLVSW